MPVFRGMSEHCHTRRRWRPILLFAAIVAVVFSVATALRADDTQPAWLRVRTPTGFGRDVVQQGYAHSPTFRRLVDHLEQTSVLVLIEPGRCFDSRVRGCVWTVVGATHQRAVVIKVDSWDTTDRLIA